MSPRLQKLATDWKTYLALLTAAGAASSLLTDVVKKATETFSVLKGLPPEARWLVAGVFLVLTVIFLVGALSRRSILLEPKRFLLSSENPEHLAGREEEVEHLARQCRRHSLVFLEGVSGSGKSSLVRAGLVPAFLHQDGPGLSGSVFVPLVIDLSGLGWQRSLATALSRGLAGMPEDSWKALGGGERPTPEGVFPWLAERPASAARRLLLILDQFDDYLSAHRSRFYEGTTLRRPGDIEAQNPDWHGFAEALRSGSICGLVVARSEAGGSLAALCFVEEAAIAREQLMRLQGNLVAPLLGRLTEAVNGQTVVSDPELGWLQLRSRLLRDLEASGEGQILPIQLSVALNSLRLLRYLTPSEYERNGGLRGLERLHVERHAQKAAEATAGPVAAVLEALLTLVNADGTKTRPGQRADFESVLSRHGAASNAAERAIRQLEDDKLLRRVPGESEGAETLLLYHDYLARGVREAYRQANRWTELLREKTALFQEAIGWRQRWRALLSPVEQLRLLRERLRGGFSFAERRRFVSLSALRWTPYLAALILAGLSAWQIDRYLGRQVAAEAIQAIGHGGSVTSAEAKQLLRLAAAGREASTHALRLAAGDPATAQRATTRVDPLISLTVGLDPSGERSLDIAESIVWPAINGAHTNSEIIIFAGTLGSHLHLAPPAAKQLAKSLPLAVAEWVRTEHSPTNLIQSNGNIWPFLARHLDRQEVVPIVNALVTRMVTRNELFDLTSMAKALKPLMAKLNRKDIAVVAAQLTSLHKERASLIPFYRSPLGELSDNLEREDVFPIADLLLAQIKTETDPGKLGGLGHTLGSISIRLDRKDVAPAALILVEHMKLHPDQVAYLGSALGSISGKLEREDVVPAAEVLVATIREAPPETEIAWLGAALGSISDKLTRDEIAPAVATLLERLKTADSADKLQPLRLALAPMVKKIDEQSTATTCEILAARMETATEPALLAELGRSVHLLGEQPTNQKGLEHGFDVLFHTATSGWRYNLGDVADGLVAVGAQLQSPITLLPYSHPVKIEQVYTDLLKSPLMVDETRVALLKGLELATGQKFSDDLWAFVDWATQTKEGRALKLDLEGPPPWDPAEAN